jgi:hypothetical protein
LEAIVVANAAEDPIRMLMVLNRALRARLGPSRIPLECLFVRDVQSGKVQLQTKPLVVHHAAFALQVTMQQKLPVSWTVSPAAGENSTRRVAWLIILFACCVMLEHLGIELQILYVAIAHLGSSTLLLVRFLKTTAQDVRSIPKFFAKLDLQFQS